MTKKNSDIINILKDDDIIALWKQGREHWNKCLSSMKKPVFDLSSDQIKDLNFNGHIVPRRTDIKNYEEYRSLFKGAKHLETFTSSEAVKLWRKGYKTWNSYSQIEDYEYYDVDFSDIELLDENVDFSQFKFPKKGSVFFDRAKLGAGRVNFSGATFGTGGVSFYKTQFGTGYVNFQNSVFSGGLINFLETNFNDGDVFFNNAIFKTHYIYFSKSVFGTGDISFKKTNFGVKNQEKRSPYYISPRQGLFFKQVNFGVGNLNFNSASFNTFYLSFDYSKILDGDLDFKNATLENMDYLEFQFFEIKKGTADFEKVNFNKANVNFYRVNFGGLALFRDCKFNSNYNCFARSSFCGMVDFRGSVFAEGTTSFYEAKFITKCIDFKNVTFGKGLVDFHGIKISQPAEEESNNQLLYIGGTLDFEYCKFEGGNINFHNMDIDTETISFSNTIFYDSNVDFSDSKIICSGFYFHKSTLGSGIKSFLRCKIISHLINYENTDFGTGQANFSFLTISHCEEINFIGVKCDGLMSFAYTSLSTPINFNATDIRSLDISELEISSKPKTASHTPIAYRKLKKLFSENKDHKKVLECFSQEKKCAFNKEIKGFELFIYRFYDLFGNFGQSVGRPLSSLVVIWLLFAFIYTLMGINQCTSTDIQCQKSNRLK